MSKVTKTADQIAAEFYAAMAAQTAEADRSEAIGIADTTLRSVGLPTYSGLLDALRRVLRHIPDDAGGCSLSDDIDRAKRAIKLAEQA